MHQMYESTLAELAEANSINANSRALLSQLEENFGAASSQYEATLQVGPREVVVGDMSLLNDSVSDVREKR